MKIVLDTNILHNAFFLNKADLISISKTARENNIQILLPEVVLKEFINQYKKELKKLRNSIDEISSKSSKLLLDFTLLTNLTKELIDMKISSYPNTLRSRLNDLGIEIIPYPLISHEKVVERDLDARRPFKESGRGYRDTLIWESVLNVVDKSSKEIPDVVFVSNNIKDFCEENILHPDLVRDLTEREISINAIKLYRSLVDVGRDYIHQLQKDPQNQLESYVGKSIIGNINLNEYILNNLQNEIFILLASHSPNEITGISSLIEDIEFFKVDQAIVKIQDIKQHSDQEIIVTGVANLIVIYEGYLFRGYEYSIPENERPVVIDRQASRHYMEVMDSVKVELDISLILDNNLKNVLNYSLELNR